MKDNNRPIEYNLLAIVVFHVLKKTSIISSQLDRCSAYFNFLFVCICQLLCFSCIQLKNLEIVDPHKIVTVSTCSNVQS